MSLRNITHAHSQLKCIHCQEACFLYGMLVWVTSRCILYSPPLFYRKARYCSSWHVSLDSLTILRQAQILNLKTGIPRPKLKQIGYRLLSASEQKQWDFISNRSLANTSKNTSTNQVPKKSCLEQESNTSTKENAVFLAYILQLDQRNKTQTVLRMLKNKETTTFHPPPWKKSSDQQDLITDKHRFQILDK